MLSRSARAETRQSRKEDIKRVMHSIDKVGWRVDGEDGHVFFRFVSGPALGEKMDRDSWHDNEAVQVDANFPADQD